MSTHNSIDFVDMDATAEIFDCTICKEKDLRLAGSKTQICFRCRPGPTPFDEKKCECGGEAAKTTHSSWCPAAET